MAEVDERGFGVRARGSDTRRRALGPAGASWASLARPTSEKTEGPRAPTETTKTVALFKAVKGRPGNRDGRGHWQVLSRGVRMSTAQAIEGVARH